MSDKGQYDPVPMTFRYFFQKWTTLFVGYSLLDYNLRLLFKTLRWRIDKARIPDIYSVDLHPDPLIFDVWHNQRRYVKFVAEDIWTFVPRALPGREGAGDAKWPRLSRCPSSCRQRRIAASTPSSTATIPSSSHG